MTTTQEALQGLEIILDEYEKADENGLEDRASKMFGYLGDWAVTNGRLILEEFTE